MQVLTKVGHLQVGDEVYWEGPHATVATIHQERDGVRISFKGGYMAFYRSGRELWVEYREPHSAAFPVAKAEP